MHDTHGQGAVGRSRAKYWPTGVSLLPAKTVDIAAAAEGVGISPLFSPSPGITLWWCDLEARAKEIGPYATWLSASEHARADRFGTMLLRNRYIAGRTALRLLLSRTLGLAPADVPLRRGARGRPELEGHGMPDFNVSHTHGAALIGILQDTHGWLRIGVDVERLDRKVRADRLAHKFLTATERRSQALLPPDERVRSFLRYWTCKEAMSKATGDGLIAPFGQLEVQLGDPPRLMDGPPPNKPSAWQLHATRPTPRLPWHVGGVDRARRAILTHTRCCANCRRRYSSSALPSRRLRQAGLVTTFRRQVEEGTAAVRDVRPHMRRETCTFAPDESSSIMALVRGSGCHGPSCGAITGMRAFLGSATLRPELIALDREPLIERFHCSA